jgi:replicative DNA helicase
LRHLKESGAIEQDADMVLFIHRPDEGIMVPDPNGKKGAKVKADWPAEVIVAKHRNGATGTLRLDWDGGLTRFSCHGYQADQYDEFAEFATQQEAF